MGYLFPSAEWIQALHEKLNRDQRYGRIAKGWEGDFLFVVEPDKPDEGETLYYYMDLWHGKCRRVASFQGAEEEAPSAAFSLTASLSNFTKVIEGELDPMQAMLTRKLKLTGSMAYLMRNVPVVLDFVRCAREVSSLET
jgi:putative sterol carrier protein